MLRITGISGSLRANSSNYNILQQLSLMAGGDIEFSIYEGLAELPHFNPELDLNPPPLPVSNFRNVIRQSDAIIICTPEYAFGVPGSLKNALDWAVSSGDFDNKPVALITASLSGEKAHAAMLNILTALSTKISPRRSLLIPFIRSKLDQKGFLNDPAALMELEELMQDLVFVSKHNNGTINEEGRNSG